MPRDCGAFLFSMFPLFLLNSIDNYNYLCYILRILSALLQAVSTELEEEDSTMPTIAVATPCGLTLPKDPVEFERFATPIVNAIAGYTARQPLRRSAMLKHLAAELGGDIKVAAQFLELAVGVRLYEACDHKFVPGKRVRRETAQSLMARCRRISIDEPVPPSAENAARRRRSNRQLRRRQGR